MITVETKIALFIELDGKVYQALLEENTRYAIIAVIKQLEGKISILDKPLDGIEFEKDF